MGRGASHICRSWFVKTSGVYGSENVGMSNRNSVENTEHRKPKVSLAMTIIQGLGGPNPTSERRLGMDSRLIFRPLCLFQTVTRLTSLEGLLDFLTSPTGEGSRRINRQEKLCELIKQRPYRKLTQVGWYKRTKVNE
jgi:hypothetical protein